MEEKQILSKAADTIVGKPVTIAIDILKTNWLHKLLIRFKLKEGKRVFVIKDAPLSTLIKISKELIDIDLKIFDQNNLLESNYQLIKNHGERMARIAAIAVTNPREDPPESLVQFFLDNLTSKELLHVATIVLQQMHIENFMHTIISIKGANVLQEKRANVINVSAKEVSQLAGEIIASGEQSAGL